MTRCARKTCSTGKPGIWRPMVQLYAHEGGTPALMSPDVRLCDECKADAKLEHFLTDMAWTTACAAVIAAGRVAPNRALTRLAWTFGTDDMLTDLKGEMSEQLGDTRPRH